MCLKGLFLTVSPCEATPRYEQLGGTRSPAGRPPRALGRCAERAEPERAGASRARLPPRSPWGARFLGRRPRLGDFVKLVLISFSIKHLSVQPWCSVLSRRARCGRDLGRGGHHGGDGSGTCPCLQGCWWLSRPVLSCPAAHPMNQGGSGAHQAEPLTSLPQPHAPRLWGSSTGTSQVPIPAPRGREGREALRVNVTLLLVPFRL